MSTGQHDVVFVGAATLDALALVDVFPQPDDRVIAEEIVYAGGGPAATAAVTAARLGISVAFVGTVGGDANGRTILEGLAEEGVDVSGVSIARGQDSAASVVVVDGRRGTRAICNRPGPRIDLSVGESLLLGAGWVHADHVGWGVIDTWFCTIGGSRPRLSVDAGNPIEDFTPRDVDLFVPTIEALRSTYGVSETDALLDLALADGARCVVATDGARGSMAATASGDRAAVPAFQINVRSTLGAGDVFHGALVAAWVRGMPLEQSLAFANVTAGLSCRGLDGRSAIPNFDVVNAHLSSLTG